MKHLLSRPLGVVGLVALMALGLAGCAEPSEELPPELFGRWTTTEARYADRFFEIQSEIIRFGTGGSGSEIYSISHVAAEPHPRGRLFRVTYLIDGEDVQFAFHYDAVAASIRLFNQSGFEWGKAGTP
jgi:hypothetical protein